MTKKVNDASADLCVIVAKISKIQLDEQVVPKDSDLDKDLSSRLAAQGLLLTYPILETPDGDLIT